MFGIQHCAGSNQPTNQPANQPTNRPAGRAPDLLTDSLTRALSHRRLCLRACRCVCAGADRCQGRHQRVSGEHCDYAGLQCVLPGPRRNRGAANPGQGERAPAPYHDRGDAVVHGIRERSRVHSQEANYRKGAFVRSFVCSYCLPTCVRSYRCLCGFRARARVHVHVRVRVPVLVPVPGVRGREGAGVSHAQQTTPTFAFPGTARPICMRVRIN